MDFGPGFLIDLPDISVSLIMSAESFGSEQFAFHLYAIFAWIVIAIVNERITCFSKSLETYRAFLNWRMAGGV